MIDLGPDTETTEAIRQLADMHRRAVSAESELSALRADAEQLRVQLAGCLCAAEGLFAERAVKGDYGWSLPYEIMVQVHHELSALRARVAELESQLRHKSIDYSEAMELACAYAEKIATLEATPVVPDGWEVRRGTYGTWVAGTTDQWEADATPAVLRALAYAIETGQRPPHASDGEKTP